MKKVKKEFKKTFRKNPVFSKRIGNEVSKTLFFKSLEIIKEKPKNILLILFFDVLFFIILIILGILIKANFPQTTDEISALFANLGISPLLLIIIFLLYNLFLIFVYSALKLPILKTIASYDNKKLKFGLKEFFLLNIIIFLTSIILFLVISSIFYYLFTAAFFKVIIVVFLIVYLLLFYMFINFNHSLFIKGGNLKKILRKSYLTAFKGIKKYYGVFSWVVVLIAAYLLFFYIFGSVAKLANMSQQTYNIIYNIISTILFYAVIFINRVYIYLISKLV